MLVEAKAIISRLTKTNVNILQASVVHAMNAGHYEVTVEHVFNALLDAAESDVAFLAMHYDLDPAGLKTTLQHSLEKVRTGNAGKPTFSPRLLDWFQDAFTVGSLLWGYNKVRSGVLFYHLVTNGSNYTTSGISAQLAGVPKDELKEKLPTIIGDSKEDGDARAGGLDAGTSGGGTVLPKGSALEADSALARFCVDFTGKARAGEIDPIFGREREIRNMIDILARRRKNNPIVIGEAGVGKTALIEGLALNIANDEVPDLLKNVEILGLDLGLLQAGASVKGEFEKRLKNVIDEVKGSAKPIIIFIDEAHLLMGGGGGGNDAANLLKPALARGELRTIAATTYSEYKKYIEKDAALERRFQPVRVEEPSVEVCTTMLRGLREKFEEAHDVIIQDEAIEAAVRLSARYITGRQLPDKAVDLLDTCGARVKVALQQKPAAVENSEVLIANLSRELGALERDASEGVTIDDKRVEELKELIAAEQDNLTELQAHYADEKACVQKVIEARQAMNKAEGEEEKAKLREDVVAAIAEMHEKQGEVPLIRPDVDEAMVAIVVSAWTGVPAGKMVADDIAALVKMEEVLTERIKGQDYGIGVIAKELRSARAGLKAPEQPLGVFLLVGPSGVGKTETALGIADLMFGGERMMVTINMSEFQEKHTVSRLIGSPPGYVGFGEGGMLTEAVRHRPYTVVLLDETEKADPDVMNLFYQVFDKGMLSDGEGRLVDFKNTVVIMTSNLATDKITNMTVAAWEDEEEIDMPELMETIKPTLSAHFKPALLARMTTIPYLPISPEAMGMITKLKLNKLMKRLQSSQNIKASYTDGVVELIKSRCTEVDTGARNIDHILRGTLIPMLSSEILSKMATGEPPEVLEVGVSDDSTFTATFSALEAAE